jgi:hypothetical protein
MISWILLVQSVLFSRAADLTVNLVPDLDQIGSQIETVQVYRTVESGVNNDRLTFGIYDTGASVVSISADDQDGFSMMGGQPVPIIPNSVATAQGIGGDLTGVVSQPGTILADGLHAFVLDVNDILNFSTNMTNATAVPNIQAFVGTASGSAALPTITGTPVHGNGLVAKVDMQGYKLDFGAGLVIGMPDLNLLPSTSGNAKLTGTTFTPTPVRIPVTLLGDNNYAAPGTSVTTGPNPVVGNISLNQTPKAADGTVAGPTQTFNNGTFLFDTGAQMTIISPKIAAKLGLDLNNAPYNMQIQGAAGNPVSVPGFNLDSLQLPRADGGGKTIDGSLKLTDVPVFVLDLGVEGLDGILGMNLWNTAEGLLYDPSDPNNASVSMTFSDAERTALTADEVNLLAGLDAISPSFGGLMRNQSAIGYLPEYAPAPEPAVWLMLMVGTAGFWLLRLRKRD